MSTAAPPLPDGTAAPAADGSEQRVQLEPSWKARVGDHLARPEMLALAALLRARRAAGVQVYPLRIQTRWS